MRLHRLQVTAFGPFAGTETVDFDALADDGLHLIHGPTGAGKSSILDAICFALFAAVPTSRGAKGALASHHAGPGSVPQVVLELTAAGRRLRITRSPAFSRPKKRGTGELTVQPSVLLEEQLAGEWVAKGNRIDEVAQVVDDVLGLGLEQFVKVVLLPQGEFAAFLRASPEDRRGLLERLFDTSRFTDVEDWLARRRRESGEVLARTRQQLDRHLQRIDDELAHLQDDVPVGSVAGPTDEASAWPVWSKVRPDEVEQELSRVRGQVDELATLALTETAAAEARCDAANRAAELGRRTEQLQQQGRSARAELDALAERDAHTREQRRRVERALRSREVRPHLDAVDRATTERDRLEQDAEISRTSAVSLCGAERLPEQVTPDEARSLADAVRDATSTVDRARDALARLETARRDHRRWGDEARELEQQAAQLRTARDDAAAERIALEAKADKLADTAARHDARRHEVRRLERAQQLTDRIQDDERRIAELAADSDERTQRWRAAEADALALRAARLDDIAGELGEQLEAGTACPVCGSQDHPSPAQRTLTDLDTSDAAITTAEAHAEGLRAAREKVQGALTTARARRDGHGDELQRALAATEASPELDADDVPAALVEARTLLSESVGARRQVPGVRHALDDLAAAQAQADARISASTEEQAAAHSRAETAGADARTQRRQVEGLLAAHATACPCSDSPQFGLEAEPEVEHEVAEACDEPLRGELDQLAVSHERARKQLDELASLLRDRDAAAERLAAALVQRAAALAEHGFADVDEARRARLSEAELTSVQEQLAAVERKRVAAQALLERAEVQAALAADEPDLEALERQAKECRERQRAADQAQSHHERAVQHLGRLADELHATLDALAPAEAWHRVLLELADCVTGTSPDNTLRMRLSSYVLAARLEEVARYANERLAVMSDGRYSLQHSDAKAARGARGGLGLKVTDAWTGVARETSSLSGGESFMAALALALGLGDAVRAEAGGLDLQTLFIDEGFGSLDEESLEQVMEVLDDLREGGRCVGIVSHVAELRQRIRAQVLVTKTTAGSHVRVRSGVEDEPAA